MRNYFFLPLALLMLAGCYETTPLGDVAPATGQEIIVELTASGGTRLAQYLGPRAQTISGTTISAKPDSLGISVRQVVRDNGEEQFWRGEEVRIARSDISRVSERRLSRGKSSLAAALVAVGAYAIHRAFGGASSDEGRRGGTPVGQ
ncbi:MAG: hypothetical protein H0U64_07575 [Gemmatimonadaceae bacterium]|nr:hypothetical protein [Gemmatimonadaceae bacterium]